VSEQKMVRLRDLGVWSGGNTPSKARAEFWNDGVIPWVSPKDMKVHELSGSEDLISETALQEGRVSLLPAEAVLVVTRSGILSHSLPVAVTKVPVTINQDIKALVPHKDVCPRYVAHALRGASQRILKTCSKHGTTVASVETAALLDFEIPLLPLDEQRKVVAEIEKQFSRLDEAVANLQRIKANLKRYKASVLKAAVEGRLVETEASIAQREGRSYETGEQLLQRILEERRAKWVSKSKYKEPVEQTTAFTGVVPAGWTSATVDQLGSVQLGKMLDKQKHTAGAPYQYLRNINVRWGAFDVSDVFEMNFENDELERFSIRSGDVLVCEGGEPARAAVWRSNQTDMKYQKALHRVRFDGAYLPDLLVIALEHLAKSGVLDELYGGSTIKHFTRETFVKLVLPVPPIAEQSRIVAEVDRHLSIIREVDADVDTNLQKAQALRHSVLKRLFSK